MDDIERKIAQRLVNSFLEAGHSVTVYDGGEDTVTKSRHPAAIIAALDSTESDVLRVYDENGKRIGWVQLIWGNGCDLISDSSCGDAFEALLAPAEALADKLS
jgi:hypothetical protein